MRLVGSAIAIGVLGLLALAGAFVVGFGGAACPAGTDCSPVEVQTVLSLVLWDGGIAMLALALGLVVLGLVRLIVRRSRQQRH
jgi:hypothetical protein